MLPLLALCLTVLMGFGGMAVDVGYWEYQQRQQQSATDAAAIGGAQQLVYAGCPNRSVANTAAQSDAATNGFADGGNVTVTVQNPPSSGPYATNECAVGVQITTTHVASFFSRLFGYPGGVTESTSATAIVTNNNIGCLYLLSQTATFNLNADVIVAPTCSIMANSSVVETLASVIDVASFGYAHSIQENLLSLFLQGAPAPMLPVADPCPAMTSCSYTAANPPPYSGGCSSYTNLAIGVVNPGCYSSFTNVGVLTMEPGEYTFTGPVENLGVVNATGVMMYVTATGGPVQFNGTVDLFSPPTTGNYANVLFYQVPTNTNPVNFNASASLSLGGLIYAPSSLGEILGLAKLTFGQYTVLVLGNAQFAADVNLTLPGPTIDQSLIKNAVLAQ